MDHEQRCAELYRLGNHGAGPVPDGLLAVGAMSCMLCKNSMRNNDYVTQLKNGKAVTWLDINEEAGLNRFYSVEGITYDYTQETAMAGGKPVVGTPVYLWVQDGRISIPSLGTGEQAEGGLDLLAERAAERLATR